MADPRSKASSAENWDAGLAAASDTVSDVDGGVGGNASAAGAAVVILRGETGGLPRRIARHCAQRRLEREFGLSFKMCSESTEKSDSDRSDRSHEAQEYAMKGRATPPCPKRTQLREEDTRALPPILSCNRQISKSAAYGCTTREGSFFVGPPQWCTRRASWAHAVALSVAEAVLPIEEGLPQRAFGAESSISSPV